MTAGILLIVITALGIAFGHPAQMALERHDYEQHFED